MRQHKDGSDLSSTVNRAWVEMRESRARDEEMALAAYRADKQHLRPRPGSACPRWVGKMLHKAHPDAGVYRVGAWQVLHNDCSGEYDAFGSGHLMDHVMISLDGHLVFEPYMNLETARTKASAYATRHGLQYSVSPTAWWNDSCVRLEFWARP